MVKMHAVIEKDIALIVHQIVIVDKGVARKKLRGGPNFATFNVTSFTYNGIFTYYL